MASSFQPIGLDQKPFLTIVQDTVDLLESITSVERAMAVPYVKIWQIDPTTGKPINPDSNGLPIAPLNQTLVTPPRFGASVTDDTARFRERPPVSLESFSVKTINPNGLILYRILEFHFVVHRPEILFQDPDPNVDSFVSMITPGCVFQMEYGWRAGQGVKNGILNGDGYVNKSNSPPTIVPGKKMIRFAVVDYKFKIMADSQIPLTIQAFEDGELNLRQALVSLPIKKSTQVSAQKIQIVEITDPYQVQDPYDKGSLQKFHDAVRNRLNQRTQKGSKGYGPVVSFKDVCDVLLSQAVSDAYTSIGYNAPTLILGDLNARVGKPAPKYKLQAGNARGDAAGSTANIGDLFIPIKDIETVFNNVLATGRQMTLYNFLMPFLNIFNDPQTWDRTNAAKDDKGVQNQTIPEVATRVIVSGQDVNFYIVDLKREFTKFASSDRLTPDELVGGTVTRQRVKDKLRDKGIPFVSFLKGNSYIEDASFEAITDEQIKSIFIRRYLNRARKEIVDSQVKTKLGTSVDPRQVLYSSAISGDILMIGNSAFDAFSLIWLDFGIKRWDGPFRVMEVEDIVGSGVFTTRVHVVSEGDDPLGTQGRLDRAAGQVVSGLSAFGGGTR